MIEEENSGIVGACDICNRKSGVLYSQPKGSGLICSNCRPTCSVKECPSKCCKEGENKCRKDGS